jgi:HEAT repeat protein
MAETTGMRAASTSALFFGAGVGVGICLFSALSGCSSDANSRDVRSDAGPSETPVERAEHLRQLGKQRKFESAPILIDALQDESPEVRKAAIEATENVIGSGVQVNAYDPPAKRQEALDRYRRLYQLAKDTGVSHVVDTIPALLEQMEDESEDVRRRAYEDIKQLTGTGLRFRADAPQSERRQVIERYRSLWRGWNQPGSKELERKRDPEKMREYNRQRVEEIRRQRQQARGGFESDLEK